MAKKWKSRASRILLAFADNAIDVDQAIDRVVGHLLDGVQCPPTDLEAVMGRLNVMDAQEDAAVAGSGILTEIGDGRFRIRYSPTQSHFRKRFTIAHELAHVIFAGTGDDWPRRGHELERLCDMIATEILMPKRVFRDEAGPFPSMSVARKMSRRFQVSLSSTAIRFAELFGISCFEIEDGYWRWSHGIGRKLSNYLISGSIEDLIASADGLPTGNVEVAALISGQVRELVLEWQASRDNERYLFMLRPKFASDDQSFRAVDWTPAILPGPERQAKQR